MTDTPEETPRKPRLSEADKKALVHLRELLEAAKAGWATEAQWRAYADRPALKPLPGQGPEHDRRSRGFLVNNLVEAGLVEQSAAVFHAVRPGAPDPIGLAIYRPT